MRATTIIDNQRNLAKAIKEARKERGLLQQELADGIGLSRRAVIDLEAEDSDRKSLFETVQKAASALGYRIVLVPVEAVGYAHKYETVNSEDLGIEEIGDDGITPDVQGGN